MHDHSQRSDELEGALRQGVEQVRSEPVPEQAMRRSLDRVRALKRPHFQPRQRPRALLAGMALVATLLLGLFLCPSSSDTGTDDRVGYDKQNANVAESHKDPVF